MTNQFPFDVWTEFTKNLRQTFYHVLILWSKESKWDTDNFLTRILFLSVSFPPHLHMNYSFIRCWKEARGHKADQQRGSVILLSLLGSSMQQKVLRWHK